MSSADSETIPKMVDTIRMHLIQNQIEPKIFYRLKDPCSILRKMRRKNLGIEKLTDVIAFRIIVDSEEDCYNSLGIISHIYEVNSEKIKDFISSPKSNGYQSLHIVIANVLDGRSIEVQIRTNDMHKAAEFGRASHKEYKQKQYQEVKSISVVGNDMSLHKAYNIMRDFNGTLLDLVNYEQEFKSFGIFSKRNSRRT